MENEYTQKLKQNIKGRVAVYIDVANLEMSVRDMFVRPDDMPDALKHLNTKDVCWTIDYEKLKLFLQEFDPNASVRFYCAQFESESHQKFRYFLDKRLGFKLITKPLKEYADHSHEHPHRKANFDVEIAVDATHRLEEFDTLILFSGDCDFEYLVKFLKGRGKVVIGFSRSGHVAKELPPVLSHYFDIANFRQIFLHIKKRIRQ